MEIKQLSVFIDESGDFGTFEKHCPYYIVSMVLHNQDDSISKELEVFKNKLEYMGFKDHAVHTAPLIRNDSVIYQNNSLTERQQLFTALFSLAKRLPIKYLSATIKKEVEDDEVTLSDKLTKSIVSTIKKHIVFFNSFDKIIVYYDNGQVQLTKIIISVFNALFSNVEMRKVIPFDYRLFQIADLFCTLELIETKCSFADMSRSELEFFGSRKRFIHDYYSEFRDTHLK